MSKRLAGKAVLITGGSSGIGKAIAAGFAKEGAHILFVYNKNSKGASELTQLIKEYGQKSIALQWDISDIREIPNLFKTAKNMMGHFDILINNVGVVKRTPFLDIPVDQLEFILATNFMAPFLLTQQFCRYLIESKQSGNVINVSSLSAKSAISKLSDYQSSKAALSMFTKSAAFELAKYNIRVNTISPGLTCTAGNEEQWKNNPNIWNERASFIPLGRAGQPEDHVGAAIYLASDEAKWVTGADIVIDGGQSVI